MNLTETLESLKRNKREKSLTLPKGQARLVDNQFLTSKTTPNL